LHDALFLDVKVDNIQENINTAKVFNNTKKYKVNNIDTTMECVVNNTSSKMCIYFNKDCYSGHHLVKEKIPTLPNSIGPDLVSSILHQAITIFVGLNYFPWNALKKIDENERLILLGFKYFKVSTK